MAGLDKDYALGISVELQQASIAEFEAQVQKALSGIAPVQIKTMIEAEPALSGVGKVTQGLENLSKQTAEATASTAKLGSELQAIGQKFEQNYQSVQKSMTQGTDIVKEQMALRTKLIADALAEQRALVDANAASQSESLKRNFANGSAFVGGNGQLMLQEDPSITERRNSVMERYVPQLNAAVESQRNLNAAEREFMQNAGWYDHFFKSMGNIAMWGAGTGIMFGAVAAIGKGFQDAIHSQQEQVIQGFYYGAQGQQFTPQLSAQTMQAAIDLSRKYGDEVMQTQEAIGLWAKATHGELLPSIQMANDALKLNSVTGMSNEEIYRSTIAVLSQYHESLNKANDIYNIGVGLATKYAGGIKMIGGEAQDAARQMIEGMDTSSAVASSFGLKMEQAAGMVVTLLQAGNVDSGKTAGEQISRSLAALVRGKPGQALAEVGIKTSDNPDILNQLVAKWNTEVPKLGETLGQAIKGSVQSSAFEPLELLINQIGMVRKATQEAYEYEKSHPLDAMYEKMKDTDAFKINQIKASFEAISITIGRQFLPAISDALDGFEKFVPTLISAGPQIATLASDFAMLGGAIAGIEIFKAGVNGIATLGGQWATVINGFKETTIEEKVAQTSLSDYQRALLATMTTEGEVTSEMETQIKTLAAVHNVSVDSMIQEMLKARGLIAEDAQAIMSSEEGIAITMQWVAAKVGLSEEEMATAFGGMAVAAEETAVSMGTAFSELLPILGQVVIGINLAKVAWDWWKNRDHAAEMEHYRDDPTARVSRENQLMTQLRWQKRELATRESDYQFNVKTYGAQWANSAAARDAENEIKALRDQIGSEIAEYHGLRDGTAWQDPNSIAQQLAANEAGIHARLKNMKPAPPDFTEHGDTQLPTSTKGISSDYAQAQTEIDRVAASFKNLVGNEQAAIDAAKSHASRLEHLIGIYGNTAQLTEKVTQAYRDEQAAVQANIATYEKEYATYENNARRDIAEANKHPKNSTEYQHWMHEATVNQNGASGLLKLIQNLKDSFLDLGVAIQKADHAYQESQFNDAKKAFEGHKITLAQLHGYAKSADDQDYVSGKQSELTDFYTSKRQELQDAIAADTESMMSGKAYDIAYWAQLRKNVEDYDRAIAEIDKVAYEDPAQANQLTALEQQWLSSADAVAQYKQALAALKDDPSFNAIISMFNSIANYAAQGLLQSANDAGNLRISGWQGEINNLNFENSILSSGPFAKYNKFAEFMNEQTAKGLEKQIEDLKNKMEHPDAFKTIFLDAEKSFVDAFTKKLEDTFQTKITDQFMNAIFGKQQTAQQQQYQATLDNTTALRNLTQAVGGSSTSLGSGRNGVLGAIVGDANAQSLLSGVDTSDGLIGIMGGSAAVGLINNLATSTSTAATASKSGLSMSSVGFGTSATSAGGSGGGAGGAAGSASSSFSSGTSSMATPSAGGILAAALYSPFGASSSGGNGSPIGTGAFGSPYGGATMTQQQANQLDAGMVPVTPSQMMSPAALAAGGITTSGGGGHFGWTQDAIGAVMAGYGAYEGYQQGGVLGSAMAGYSTYTAGMDIAAAFGDAAAAGPYAIAAAAVVGLASLFHPHYSPETNPDMYGDDGYAQGVANAQGTAYTQANGYVYEDAGLKQQLGGMTELQYLTSWYNKYPGGAGLNSAAQQLWNQIGTLTGGGKGLGIAGLHQGNIYVSDSSGHQVGMSGNWQDVLTTIDNETQALYTLLSSDQSVNTPIISVNAYGGMSGGVGFSPWYTPGLTNSEINSIVQAPYSPGAAPSPYSPSGGAGGGNTPIYGGTGGYGGSQTMVVTTNLNLDGSVVAASVNSYRFQREQAGFASNT